MDGTGVSQMVQSAFVGESPSPLTVTPAKNPIASDDVLSIQHQPLSSHSITSSVPVRRVTVTAHNLGYSIRGTTILKGINLVVEPGEILAIVGPSGAGKSTMLNCLSFRTKRGARTGTVNFNGLPATAKEMRQCCNYVMTDGRMLPYLTVYETLMIAANLKLPLLPKEERVQRVEHVMKDLGLLACRDTYIGGEWKKGISTGEKKRVCIAAEMIANPSVLLLDEPTNGLDSTLTCELFGTLQRLAASGRTIILSIHQPSSQIWNMLDQLLLIAHGQTVYYGSARQASAYFERYNFSCPKNFNPADYFLCLMSDDPSEANMTLSNQFEERRRHNFSDSSSVKTIASSASDIGASGAGGADVSNSPMTTTASHELESGFSSSPLSATTGVPERLISIFRDSREKDVLDKRIGVIFGTAGLDSNTHHRLDRDSDEQTTASSQKDHYTGKRCSGRRRALHCWFSETVTLAKRCFLNSIRNPVVCCVTLLVQALQGIILGGIFWKLTAEVAGQQPISLDTQALVNNPWSQLFIHGIHGRQPILDFMERGVDGHGSEPLVTFFKDTEAFVEGYNVMSCGLPEIPALDDYPTFGVRPSEKVPPVDTMDQMEPDEAGGIAVGMTQVFDYLYNRQDWSQLDNSSSVLYYSKLLTGPGQVLILPWMVCAGYPKPSDLSIEAKKPPTDSHRRRLITIGDIGVTDALIGFLGSGGHQMIEATKEIFARLRACPHGMCNWIDRKATDAYDVGKQAYDASMATVNILGALFFAVANLGFSSYDALLTFPQERLLFNRESANGLYSPSSYFLAKNLADLPFQLVPNFVLVTIYYFMIGLGGTVQQYIIYFLVCAGITFAAYGFGYLVSAASPRMEIAVLAAPFVLVIWLTISGFFLRDAQIPRWIHWFTYLSFYKWGFFSLVVNQFPLGGSFGVLPNHAAVVMAGITETRVWLTGLILLLLGLLYRLLAFIALKYTNRSVGIAN